jgi:hypothetical protein
MDENRDQWKHLYPTPPTPGQKRVHWLSAWDQSCGPQGPNKGRMSRKETATSADKRHKVGHDITQVHPNILSKQQVAEYFNQLCSAGAKIQMSANEKIAALSNPDQLDIEESPQALQAQDQLTPYEQLRAANIRRNTALLESMGLVGGASKLLHAPLQRETSAEEEQDMDSDEAGPAPPH